MNHPATPLSFSRAGAFSTRSVLFIDATVAGGAALGAKAAPGVLVVHLDPARDGVRQIAEVLQAYAELDSVQIVAHGAAGTLQLGSATLDAAALPAYADALGGWGAALRDGGDILLYGCSVAQGGAGLAFVDALADLSGADVAASTDLTGAASLGGDWLLEYASGPVEAASALDAAAAQDYAHTLGLTSNGTITFDTSVPVTLLNAGGLAAGAVVHVDNILGLGLDVYARSALGGSIKVSNDPAFVVLGIPLNSAHLAVNGSLLSPATYVDLRANSGVFDLLSMRLGSSNLLGDLLGSVVFTVHALDANYQPTGVGVSLLSLVINEYGLLNFASMANFNGIYGVRISNPLGFEVGIDDLVIANARQAPAINSASYNAGAAILSVSAVGLVAGESIDPGKLSITGQNGASYTLTSAVVSASSATGFSVTLNAADKLAVNGLLNNNGANAVSGTAFTLSAAANWDSSSRALADSTGNAITVSNVQAPGASSATYNAATHTLTVSGSNLVGTPGGANDISASKLTFTGEGGASRTLSTSSSVELSSANGFSLTLGGADIAAVEALMTRNGLFAAGGAAYNLALGDDWNSVIGASNTAVATVGLTVSNALNLAPALSGAAPSATADNASAQPFAGVSVSDPNGDNVSMAISFNGANGTLSGAGLSGAGGSYALAAASPAALGAALRALVFTPTPNQAVVGAGVATTFTLTPSDSQGLAGAASSASVLTATSVNDAPVIGGASAAGPVTPGATAAPFGSVQIGDPDVGAAVIVTVSPDSAAKGAFTAASLSASGFASSDGGQTYTHAAAAPAAAQAALRALVFQTTAGLNATTTFTIQVNDGSAIAINSGSTLAAVSPSATVVLSAAFSSDSGSSASDLVTNVAAQTISGTLSAPLAGGESVQVSLDNGLSWSGASIAPGASSWSLAGQTLSGSGVLQVRVANAGGGGTPLVRAWALDTSAPLTGGASVVFSNDSGTSASDLVTNLTAQAISGTLTANLAGGETVEVSLDNGASWAAASAAPGSPNWSLAGQTLTSSNTLLVRVNDAAGNHGATSANAYVLDSSGPGVSIASNSSVLKSGEVATITLSFSEAPAGLVLGDLVAVGGTLSNLAASADPRVYTLEFTPGAGLSGFIGGILLGAGSYTDAAGNAGAGGASAAIAINTIGPAVAISSSAAVLKAGESAVITFTFSSAPQGFALQDIGASGGVLSALAPGANPLVYTAVFTPSAGVDGGVASIGVASGSYTDIAGNPGGAGASPVIAVDTRAPTVVITSDLGVLNASQSAALTFTFSEAPQGFGAADVNVAGGSLSGFAPSADARVFHAIFTPAGGVANGSASIDIGAASYSDAAGNSGSGAPTLTLSVHTQVPATGVSSLVFSSDTGTSTTDLVTSVPNQNLSGTLNGPLAVGERVEVSLDNGASWTTAVAAPGASAWSLGARVLSGANTAQVRVSDLADNHSVPFSAAYRIDQIAPGVAIASDSTLLHAGQSANLTLTFSEAPSGLSAAALSASGGSIGSFAPTVDPLVYTAIFTPTPGVSGLNAVIGMSAGSYRDAAGNLGAAASAAPIAIDTLLPAVSIASDRLSLNASQNALLTFSFNTVPTGFSAADISVLNGSIGSLSASANPLVYTALLSPAPGMALANATVSVLAGSYTDSQGNPGAGASGPAIALDTLAPGLSIQSDRASLTVGQSALLTFTFSEAPLGFSAADVTVSRGVLSAFGASANPLVYTAVFTPSAGIEYVDAVIGVAGAYADAAGNSGSAATSLLIGIDTLAPAGTAAALSFSTDTGASTSDLVTNVALQTIGGTLDAPRVAGEVVEISLDNGASWSVATSSTGSSAFSLPGQVLGASGTVQVRLSDGAGNHGLAYAAPYLLDQQAPAATIVSDRATLAIGQSAQLTITFSEPPRGFGLADLSVTGGSLDALSASADPLVWHATFTPTAGLDGVAAQVGLLPAGYTDLAGNPGGAASVLITVDTAAPASSALAVQFSDDSGASASDLVTNVAVQTISGSLGAVLAAGELVEISLDNGLNWSAASAAQGSAAWSLAGQTLSGAGAVQVRVSDAAGNHGPLFAAPYAIDTSAPSLTIGSDKTLLNSADVAVLSFRFSQAPDGFAASDIDVTGGVLSGFAASADPLVYTALLTPTAGQLGGSATVGVAAGSYLDAAGNAGLGASGPALSYNTVAPGVAISSDRTVLKSGESAIVTFRFSSAPQGFDVGDIAVSGATLGGLSASADPLVYHATLSAANGVSGVSAQLAIGAASYTDGLGNPGTGASMAPLPVDTAAPSLVIGSSAAALKSGDSATITFTFSEAPAAFSLADVTLANGSLSNLQAGADPRVYTAQLLPAPGVAAGNVTMDIAPGAYTDLAGNPGAGASGPQIALDTLAPSIGALGVTFSSDSGASASDLSTRFAAQQIGGTLGGPLALGERVEVSLDNGINWQVANATAGGTVWTLAGQMLTASNTLQVRVSDAAGNHGAPYAAAYVLDTSAPTVSISSGAAALTAGQSATISFTFSEAPQGFALGDLVASGGTLSGFSATASPLVYTVQLTPTAGSTGLAGVTLGAGLYSDGAGNPGAGASSAPIGVDARPPSLLIASSASALGAGQSAIITFTFSEAPQGFNPAAIGVTNGILSALTASADPLVYTALLTPAPGNAGALAAITVAPGAYTDAAGNPGLAAAAPAIAVDTLAPSMAAQGVRFSLDLGPSNTDLVTNAVLQDLAGTLDGPLGIGDLVEVSFDQGASWRQASASVGNNQWLLPGQMLGAGAGELQVRVSDAAGNHGPLLSTTYLLDLSAPTLAIASSSAALKSGESATLSFTFSEAPQGFVEADLVVLNGTLSGFGPSADARVYTALLTPTPGLPSGAVSGVSVAAGRYTDLASNSGAGAASPLIQVDNQAPSLTIGSDRASVRIGELATLSFTFSEAPLGFDLGDIALAGGGSISGFGLTADPLVYTALYTPELGVASASAVISVAAASYADAAGNPGLGAAAAPIAVDTLAPAAAPASVTLSADSGASASDGVTGTAAQFIGGTLDAPLLPGDLVEYSFDNGASWTVAASAPASSAWSIGAHTLSEGANSLQLRVGDSAGNRGPASVYALLLDSVAPTLLMGSSAAILGAGQSAQLSFTFSEAPQGFALSDLVVSGASLSNFGPGANPLVWEATLTPTPGFNGTASVTLAPGLYADLAGNPGPAGALPALVVDSVAPSLSIASSAATLRAGQSATITFTFDEAPVGFGVQDISVGGGVLSGFAVGAVPTVYTALFTPTPDTAAGSATIAVGAGLYADLAGNPGAPAAMAALSYDTLLPTTVAGSVAFSSDTGVSAADLITAIAAQDLSGSLTAPLLPGETVLVSLDNGASWSGANAVAGASSWSLAGQVLSGSGVLRVRLQDAAGNHGPDLSAPYQVSSVPASAQIVSADLVINGVGSTTITLTFNAPPVGLSLADLSASSGLLANLSAGADPRVYSVQYTPEPNVANGSVTITLAPTYGDVAGNGGTGAQLVASVDSMAPVANPTGTQFAWDSGSSSSDLVTNVQMQNLSGALSSALAAGERVEVSVDSGSTWRVASSAAGNTVWNLDGVGLMDSNSLHVQVRDQAGNVSTPFRTAYQLDMRGPSVSVGSSLPALAAGQSALISFTLSDPVPLKNEHISVSGGTLSALVAGSGGLSYQALFTASGENAVASVGVLPLPFVDLAGNPSLPVLPLLLGVTAAPVSGPATMVDGVPVRYGSGIDPVSALPGETLLVPLLGAERVEDPATQHRALADIPFGVAGGPGGTAGLWIGVPTGSGLSASGPSIMLSGEQAQADLGARIAGAVADPVSRSAMASQLQAYLARGALSMQHEDRSVAFASSSVGEAFFIAGMAPGAGVNLVIDARSVAAGSTLELEGVDFAALLGAIRVAGGSAGNVVSGDGAAQVIVFDHGDEDDFLYGNGGDDVLGSWAGADLLDGGAGSDILAAGAGNDRLDGGSGDDVLQGGQSDRGAWQFFLDGAGRVGARHSSMLADGEPVLFDAAAFIRDVPELAFLDAPAALLHALSLLYHSAFGRAPDLPGLAFWATRGIAVEAVARDFMISPEGASLRALDNRAFIDKLFQNSLQRDPSAEQLAPLLARLEAAPGDMQVRAGVLSGIALAEAHRSQWIGSDGVALGGTTLQAEMGWIAGSGDDRLLGGTGNDRLVGGDGVDVAVFGGQSADYSLHLTRAGELTLRAPDGALDTLVGIEQAEFDDLSVDVRFTQQSAALLEDVAMLYHLVLNRDGELAGVLGWMGSGQSGAALARHFVDAPEFARVFGTPDDRAFVELLYRNAYEREGAPALMQQWQAYLGDHSRAELVALLIDDITLVGSQYGADGLTVVGAM
jgi:hypothetical protein